VGGDGCHEHADPDAEPGAVRRGVGADQGEREQVPGEQHVGLHQRRRDGGEQVRPVHQPQPPDVQDRGDGGVGQHGCRA